MERNNDFKAHSHLYTGKGQLPCLRDLYNTCWLKPGVNLQKLKRLPWRRDQWLNKRRGRTQVRGDRQRRRWTVHRSELGNDKWYHPGWKWERVSEPGDGKGPWNSQVNLWAMVRWGKTKPTKQVFQSLDVLFCFLFLQRNPSSHLFLFHSDYLGSWPYFLFFFLFVANCIFHRGMPPIYSFHSTHSTYNVTDACPTESRVYISFSQICMGTRDCSPSKVEEEVRLRTSLSIQ